jgi:hypothetical protein
LGQRVESFLCFECIERRLGRQLKQEELPICAWNEPWIAKFTAAVWRHNRKMEMTERISGYEPETGICWQFSAQPTQLRQTAREEPDYDFPARRTTGAAQMTKNQRGGHPQ